MGSWAEVACAGTMPPMQVITTTPDRRPPRSAVVHGTVVGGALIATAFILAWLAFGTPLMDGFAPSSARPGTIEVVAGAAVWGLALVLPASLALVGLVRLARVYQILNVRKPKNAVTRAASSLGPDLVAVCNLQLPDGRTIQNLVIGPFGVAVMVELPPPRVTRRNGTAWEIHRADGKWVMLENPLERTMRDAERVKRWIGAEERDFVVKVHAAVVTPDSTVPRTPSCAVVAPNDVAAWLSGLPPQRSLTQDRREDLLERVREII